MAASAIHITHFGDFYKAFVRDGAVVIFHYDIDNHRTKLDWSDLNADVRQLIIDELKKKKLI